MLQHSIQRVLESNVQEVIVVLGYAAEEIMPVISSAGIKVLTNPHYNRGLSESLKVGLRAVSPDSTGALIYLADQPLVSPRTIDKLIETFKATRALAVVPTYRGERGNPVVLAKDLFPEVMKLSGDMGARSLLEKYAKRIVLVEVEDVAVIIDIDTPRDLERWSLLLKG